MNLVPALTAIALAAAPVPVAASPTAAELLDKVQEHYAKVDHLTAGFTQTLTNTTFGQTKTMSGRVYLKRPGKMRFDYASKLDPSLLKKSIRSDGKHLWVVEHDNMQIIVKALGKDPLPAAVQVFNGARALAKDFRAALAVDGTYGGKDDVVVRLTPKSTSVEYKHVFVVVDPSDAHVRETVVVDAADNVNRISYDAIDTVAPVADDLFKADVRDPVLAKYKIVRVKP